MGTCSEGTVIPSFLRCLDEGEAFVRLTVGEEDGASDTYLVLERPGSADAPYRVVRARYGYTEGWHLDNLWLGHAEYDELVRTLEAEIWKLPRYVVTWNWAEAWALLNGVQGPTLDDEWMGDREDGAFWIPRPIPPSAKTMPPGIPSPRATFAALATDDLRREFVAEVEASLGALDDWRAIVEAAEQVAGRWREDKDPQRRVTAILICDGVYARAAPVEAKPPTESGEDAPATDSDRQAFVLEVRWGGEHALAEDTEWTIITATEGEAHQLEADIHAHATWATVIPAKSVTYDVAGWWDDHRAIRDA